MPSLCTAHARRCRAPSPALLIDLRLEDGAALSLVHLLRNELKNERTKVMLVAAVSP